MQQQFVSDSNLDDVELNKLTGRTIFLSYRARDEPQVHGLRVLLGCLGNSVTKMGEFPPGRWAPHIYQSLANSDTLLIYLSKEPSKSRVRDSFEDFVRKLRRFWNDVLLRRTAPPEDWMREEFEHFRKLHGESRDIIVYAEADAERPSHLRDFQVHYFVTKLTEIRKKWNELRSQRISKREAKRIVLADLRENGITLDDNSKEIFFDLFGINGLRSAARYLWAHIYTTFSKIYVFGLTIAVLALAAGMGFSVPRYTISVPDVTQVPIGLNQTGSLACGGEGLVCVSASQTRADVGRVNQNEFYGYVTPTCESRVQETTECRPNWQMDYRLTNVVSRRSTSTASKTSILGTTYMCLSEPSYRFANCVDPLGD